MGTGSTRTESNLKRQEINCEFSGSHRYNVLPPTQVVAMDWCKDVNPFQMPGKTQNQDFQYFAIFSKTIAASLCFPLPLNAQTCFVQDKRR